MEDGGRRPPPPPPPTDLAAGQGGGGAAAAVVVVPIPPTNAPTGVESSPSIVRRYPTHPEPPSDDAALSAAGRRSYFNYNATDGSRFGPSTWGGVVAGDEYDYWGRTFLDDDDDDGSSSLENMCQVDGIARSPIDVCTRPEGGCEEFHEIRSRGGDYRIGDDALMTKQILPNKLRVVVSRRPDEVRMRCLAYAAMLANVTAAAAADAIDPDDELLCASEPPGADFANTQQKALDLLNIDIKFPSEHTVCGRKYDGEMQYYYFHPVRRTLLVVAWLLEATIDGSPANGHLQLLIDQFRDVYDANESACRGRDAEASATPGGVSPTSGRLLRVGRRLAMAASPSSTPNEQSDPSATSAPSESSSFPSVTSIPIATSSPSESSVPIPTSTPSESSGPTVDPGPWDPFHPDIQRTIHFWGYAGSLTEVPCTDAALWRIMDVPVRITIDQLDQMRNMLFNNRDPRRDCAYTSTHYEGSVARPINGSLPYYICTRDDYVSDDEREACGSRRGCAEPYGPRLGPYVEPIVHVTGPPSESPTSSTSPSLSPSGSPTVLPTTEFPTTSMIPSGSPTASLSQPIDNGDDDGPI
ncbi:hypothetical protein ACHAW5_006679 [Stephanodiscus triporus]|uniref:carbonic anhydrase n=1 Tax=Stephanodiscus triporus TaxID=2934178 RepID=A0ABD3MDG5_9STRA